MSRWTMPVACTADSADKSSPAYFSASRTGSVFLVDSSAASDRPRKCSMTMNGRPARRGDRWRGVRERRSQPLGDELLLELPMFDDENIPHPPGAETAHHSIRCA